MVPAPQNVTIDSKLAIFVWNQVQGNFSMITIEKCDADSCETIKETIHPLETTEILLIEDAENFHYYLVIYQSDEEVYREAFDMQKQQGDYQQLCYG